MRIILISIVLIWFVSAKLYSQDTVFFSEIEILEKGLFQHQGLHYMPIRRSLSDSIRKGLAKPVKYCYLVLWDDSTIASRQKKIDSINKPTIQPIAAMRKGYKPILLNVKHNQATDYFTAETKIERDFANAQLVLISLEGKEIKRIVLKKKRNQLIVTTDGIKPGTYVLKLVVNGSLLDSKKLIIAK